MQLSVVLPCFNEELNIQRTVSDVCAWMKGQQIDGEVIAVNDGSTDKTAEILQQLEQEHPDLRVVTHEENRGYGAAVTSGCDAATKEWIGFMDSDGQFKAEDFDRLLPFTADYAFVTGKRRKRADPLMRKLYPKLFGGVAYLVLGIWVRDINCAMKVFRKDLWQKIHPRHATGAMLNYEIFYRLHKQGIPWKRVDVSHYPRLYGAQTGANPKVVFRAFMELFTLRKNYAEEKA